MRIDVAQEPRQKGTKGFDDAAVRFRRAVREQMSERGHGMRPRAPLALDIRFVATRPSTPALHHLVKCYLDLLGVPRHGNDAGEPLLYGDDRQVKLLHATLWRVPAGRPAIRITARSRADAIASMALASRIHAELEDADPHWAEELATDDDGVDDDRDESWRELLADDDPYWRAVGERGRRLDAFYVQQRLLTAFDRLLALDLSSRVRPLLTGIDSDHRRRLKRLLSAAPFMDHDFDRWLRDSADVHIDGLWTAPFYVRLPPLPAATGERKAFRAGVQQACARFLERFPVLRPLRHPLRVSVLLVQPAGPRHIHFDLDNVLAYVLPAVEEVFRPPVRQLPIERLSGDLILDDDSDPGPDAAPHRLAMAACQILQVERRESDPDTGRAVVVLGNAIGPSLWEQAERYIDRGLDDLDDYA